MIMVVMGETTQKNFTPNKLLKDYIMKLETKNCVIKTRKDVPLKENQKIMHFYKGQCYIIKEQNGNDIVEKRYSLPENKLEYEFCYSTTTPLGRWDEPMCNLRKTYYDDGSISMHYDIQNGVIINVLTSEGKKTIKPDLTFTYFNKVDGREGSDLWIGRYLNRNISKAEFESKLIPERLFSDFTGNDWVRFHFEPYDNRCEDRMSIAPNKIIVEYNNKIYEYDFDIQEYNENNCDYIGFCSSCKRAMIKKEHQNFICDECKSKMKDAA